jgi:serine/threonine protein kinase
MSQPFTSFSDFKRRYPIRPNDEGVMLGSGSYGRVIKVEDQVDTEWVAVKISEFKGSDTKSLRAEVELAQRLPRHSNIARYDACYRLETDTSISDFAIMKYYPDGNLADLIRHEKLTPAQIYDLTKGILLGLRHLHQHHIVHRDFKPANILISRDSSGCFIPKIADFGLSKLVSEDELDGSDFDLSDGRGTPSYKAPEQIEGSKVSFNLDLWAFGVILFEIMTGEKPFRVDQRNTSEQSIRREIEKQIVTVALPASMDQITEPYHSIIRRCLIRDIRERVRREDELLDLLDRIDTLLADARTLFGRGQYDESLGLYEQVLTKRENQNEAQRGVEQCKAAIEKQWIAVLMRKADSLFESQQPEQAEKQFDEVLRLAPTNKLAIEGKARCLDRLQLKQPHPMSEQTDIYEEAQTDAYVDVPLPAAPKKVAKQTAPAETTRTKPNIVKPAAPTKLPSHPIAPASVSVARPFPWRLVAPIAAGLAGLALYFTLSGTPNPPIAATSGQNNTQRGTISAAIQGNKDPGSISPESPVTALTDNKAVLNKRIDAALKRAQRAYQQKDYQQTLVLTKSALLLDPTRRDVAFLQSVATEAQQKADVTAPQSVLSTEVPKTVLADAPKTEPAKAPEPDPKVAAEAAKKEAQQQYDQLIENGIKAISGGNNKAKAIAAFNDAEKLAKQHDLNTAKANDAYVYAMQKGDSYYGRATYDGAKDWYLVAQAAKSTKEVQKQLRLCTNQTQ